VSEPLSKTIASFYFSLSSSIPLDKPNAICHSLLPVSIPRSNNQRVATLAVGFHSADQLSFFGRSAGSIFSSRPIRKEHGAPFPFGRFAGSIFSLRPGAERYQ
jgi:hypothetical protein